MVRFRDAVAVHEASVIAVSRVANRIGRRIVHVARAVRSAVTLVQTRKRVRERVWRVRVRLGSIADVQQVGGVEGQSAFDPIGGHVRREVRTDAVLTPGRVTVQIRQVRDCYATRRA